MKADPIELVLGKNFKINKNIYFISGNEPSLIERVKEVIINFYKINENLAVSRIDTIEKYKIEFGLFEKKKLYLLKNSKGLNDKLVKDLSGGDDVFIFIQENSPKIKSLKNYLSKEENVYLIDCYELDRDKKIRVLNELIRINNIVINKDEYWYLLEKLDNKYIFLENNFNKLKHLSKGGLNVNNIDRILSIGDTAVESLFFLILKKNNEIVNSYKNRIVTNSDVNEFFFRCKYFCMLIIDNQNEENYLKEIPKYLFKEKKLLIDIYRKYDFKKKRELLSLISNTEKTLRKDVGLSIFFGLRFILTVKRITIS